MNATSFRDLMKTVCCFIAALGLVLGLAGSIATPEAEAQTTTPIPSYIDTRSTYTYTSGNVLNVEVVSEGKGPLKVITIDYPNDPTVGISGYTLWAWSYDRTWENYSTDVQSMTRDPKTGLITITLKNWETFVGDNLAFDIRFNSTTAPAIPADFGGNSTMYATSTSVTEPTAQPAAGRDPELMNPAGTMTPSDVGWLPGTYTNPEMPQRCGLNVGLVFDLSNSILEQDNAVGNMKDAATAIVNELNGTPTEIGFYTFNSMAPADYDDNKYTRHNDITMPSADLSTPEGVDQALATIDSLTEPPGGLVYGGTNWEMALKQAKAENYDVVYVITDGIPTTNNDYQTQDPTARDYGSVTHVSDIADAMTVANEMKQAGTRIVPIMINVNSEDSLIVSDEVFMTYGKAYDALNYYGQSTFYWDSLTVQGRDQYGRLLYQYQGSDGYTYLTTEWTSSPYLVQKYDSPQEAYDAGELVFRELYYDSYYGVEQYGVNEADFYDIRNSLQMAEDISSVDAPVYLGSYADLAKTLYDSIVTPCQGKLIVEKQLVNSDGSFNKSGVDWEFTATSELSNIITDAGTTGSQTKRTDESGLVEYKLDAEKGLPTKMTVREVQQEGFSLYQQDLKNAKCTVNDGGDMKDLEVANLGGVDDPNPGFELTVPTLTSTPFQLATVTCQMDNTKPDLVPPAAEKLPRAGEAVKVRPDGTATLDFTLRLWNDQAGKRAVANLPADSFHIPDGVLLDGPVTLSLVSKSTGVAVSGLVERIDPDQIGNGRSVAFAERIELPNLNDEIIVKVSMPVKATAATPEQWQKLGECAAQEGGTWAGGVPNSVEVSGDANETDNHACIPLIPPTFAGVSIAKVDAENREQTLDGAEFTVYESNTDDSEPDYNKPVFTIDGNTAKPNALSGGTYWLVETKSAPDYQLLAQPVRFTVTGTDAAWFAEISGDMSGLIEVGPNADAPSDTIFIKVADVRTGTLPRTGGFGVGLPAALAMTLIAAGFLLARRRA